MPFFHLKGSQFIVDKNFEATNLSMLVLTRKLGESIAIDDEIKIVVVQIKGRQVRLGIEAPRHTKIHREEVYIAIQEQNKSAAESQPNEVKKVAKLLSAS